jgi:hypothetical protein
MPVAEAKPTARAKARAGGTSTSGALPGLGIPHEFEYVTADELLSLDLAIMDRRFALET